jgi:adenylate cyclase, class 2
VQYEVEQKFPVAGFDAIQSHLERLGARFALGHEEADVYFSHPQRDFRASDEAFRLRRRGESNRVTYKGPKIDATTKTRRELELALPDGREVVAQWTELLETLGFRQVGQVAKRRRKFEVDWKNRTVEGTFDEIDGLGQFIELELVVNSDDVDEAKRTIASLAAELGLASSERRSYLQLLMAK